MKHFLLLAIKLYWITVPKNKRRQCLFRKSCSHFVFENTIQFGLFKGLAALRYRIKNCREGSYIFINPVTNKIQMILPGNEVVDEMDISQTLLNNFKGQII